MRAYGDTAEFVWHVVASVGYSGKLKRRYKAREVTSLACMSVCGIFVRNEHESFERARLLCTNDGLSFDLSKLLVYLFSSS